MGYAAGPSFADGCMISRRRIKFTPWDGPHTVSEIRPRSGYSRIPLVHQSEDTLDQLLLL